MKYLIMLVILLSPIIIANQFVIAEISISETDEIDDELRTIFQIISDIGKQKEKIIVKGLLPRLSPNKKSIIYFENPPKGGFKIALRHLSGTKIEHPPFIDEKKTVGWTVTGLEWSPDSQKIAAVFSGPNFYPNGRPVQVLVYDLYSKRFNKLYESKAETSEAAYFLFVKWFPDNKRILIQDNLIEGHEKITTATVDGNQSILHEGATIYSNIVYNGKAILIMPIEEQATRPSRLDNVSINCQILLYDLDKQKISKIAKVDISINMHNMCLISPVDSTILILPSNKSAGSGIRIVDLLSGDIQTVNFNDRIFFPQTISQDGRNLLCGITKKGFEIYNFKTNEFKLICEHSNVSLRGEELMGAMIFFNKIEWIK